MSLNSFVVGGASVLTLLLARAVMLNRGHEALATAITPLIGLVAGSMIGAQIRYQANKLETALIHEGRSPQILTWIPLLKISTLLILSALLVYLIHHSIQLGEHKTMGLSLAATGLGLWGGACIGSPELDEFLERQEQGRIAILPM